MTTSANELYGSPKRQISIILPVLNEADHLEESIHSILSQDYLGDIEIILAIGPSHDGTENIAQALADKDSRIVLVENPSGRTASALNIAIAATKYSIIVRVDGHSQIPKNYLTLISSILEETGAVNVGGVMDAQGRTLFERGVARAMKSALGVGASRFHTGGAAGEVDTVYLGAFRKDALLAAGGFDERFTRAQDWELNFRLRSVGGIIYFDPRLIVTYRPRPSVLALAKQYFNYGRWRRVVSRTHQGTINYRYLAPPIAVLGSALSILMSLFLSIIFIIPLAIYLTFILLASFRIARSIGEIICMPLILLTMHMSWGLGFITSPKSLAPKAK
ncbi:MAG: glycosyltransferase family 2 protein [Actinobacteria bacterium]|nr:glycosyltransferase family 2 protein [Actinomycetota bacterium]